MGSLGWEQKKLRTRDAIIEAGVTLMAEKGFDGATTNEIAAAAGVSAATLFNYFPTKRDILFGDMDLWGPPENFTAGSTVQESLLNMLVGMLDQPGWTRHISDPLTAKRFAIVRQTPELARHQLAAALETAPVFAQAVHEVHHEVPHADCLALAGAATGAVATVASYVDADDLPGAIVSAARTALHLRRPRG